jgi:hypothetical protein
MRKIVFALFLAVVLLLMIDVQVGRASTINPDDYISGIDHQLNSIFMRGVKAGNHPNGFAKVGDSITAAAPFSKPMAGIVDYGAYGYLQPTVAYFNASGSWSAESAAARGGYTSTQLLMPELAPTGCDGVSSLECEYNRIHPSYAVILIGTNDAVTLRQIPIAESRVSIGRIIEITLDRGIIPILTTIPPNNRPQYSPNVVPFNEMLSDLATIYRIPLLDYYSAMLLLPNRGMSPDKLHPSTADRALWAALDLSHEYGYNLRNLLTVNALRRVREAVDHGQVDKHR